MRPLLVLGILIYALILAGLVWIAAAVDRFAL